ncbi:hypothetical protein JAAARDRAFT_55955 [Jaapia argillacea MUCL 33604]|uniref:F-box domain-containing protein n=1 Tax=Jaapia argillacea MUCL 33604 TaxID=933084 RepID=A0A067QCP8_9AGAM|nr:hypothetical protein JAAARDRAFT_55955 [Jaapia argillacea MUCL 33604]
MNDHSAAQFALCIPEICQYICEQATKTDLCRLARTSRAFMEPALGRLWETMDSLEPLLKLISSLDMTSEWDHEDNRFFRRTWTIPRPIREDDWARFDEHARRIRILRCIDNSIVDFDIFYNLFLQRGRPLLPLLHHLHLTHQTSAKPTGTRAMVQNLVPFLSPSLISLNHYCESQHQFIIVDPGAEREELDRFFGMLPTLCPYLRTYVSSYPHPMISLQPFTQLSQLRSLDLRCISSGRPSGSSFDAQAIHILASLQSLETLCVRGVYGHCFDGVSGGRGFPSLRSLSISRFDSKGLSRFLDFIPPASLTKLTAFNMVSLTVGEVLPALQRFTPSLKEFFWTMRPSTALQATLDNSLLLIEPLLDLKHLEILHIAHMAYVRRISFLESHIERMSTAWPSLRIFGACSPLFTFDLSSLVASARQFPTLRSLKLHLDLQGGLAPLPVETLPRSNSIDNLTILSISPPTYDPGQLGQYIFDLFPHFVYFEPPTFESELGREVNELIKRRDQAIVPEADRSDS